MEDDLDVALGGGHVGILEFLDGLGHDLIQPLLTRGLVRDHDRIANRLRDQRLHFGSQRRIDRFDFHFALLAPDQLGQFGNLGDDLLNLGMSQGQRFQHRGLGQFIGTRFDHHDGIGRPGYHQMEIAHLQCLQIGIHDKLALHPADLHTGHRSCERDIRNR